MKAISLRLPPDLKMAANRAAAEQGLVMAVWIRVAMAEKIARDKRGSDDVSGARRAAAATAKR